jgi:hypothetical protein
MVSIVDRWIDGCAGRALREGHRPGHAVTVEQGHRLDDDPFRVATSPISRRSPARAWHPVRSSPLHAGGSAQAGTLGALTVVMECCRLARDPDGCRPQALQARHTEQAIKSTGAEV